MVCHVSDLRDGTYSKYRTINCKDHEGKKITITLYRNQADSCTKRNIYAFKGLRVDKYKGPDDEFFRLSAITTTIISSVDSSEEVVFGGIALGDFRTTGCVVGKLQTWISLNSVKLSYIFVQGFLTSRCTKPVWSARRNWIQRRSV